MARPGSISLGWRAIRRRLVSQPATVVVIFVATLIAAVLIAAGPRLLEEVASDDLEATVTEPNPAQRNMRMERNGRIGAGPADEPFLPLARIGEAFLSDEVPPSVAAVMSDQRFVVDTPQFVVSPLAGEEPPNPFPTFFTYRYQEGIDDHLTLIEGRLPSPQEPVTELLGTECPTDPDDVVALKDILASEDIPDDIQETDCSLEELPHFQAAVTRATADEMGLEIGRMVLLTPDQRDRLYLGLSGANLRFGLILSVSGIIELSDQAEEFWYGQIDLHHPRVRLNADFQDIFAMGLMSPDDYSLMLRSTGGAGRNYTWRHFVDPELMGEADLDTFQAELNPFLLEYSPIGARATDPRVITQLDDLLAQHESQRDQTVALLSVAVAGVFGVVIAVVVLLAVLMADRHRSSDVLMRGRGASGSQLTTTGFFEALLLAAPAGAVAYLIVAASFPDTDYLLSSRMTVALVVAVIIALVTAGLGVYWGRLGDLLAPRPMIPRTGPQRLVFEVFVITLAVGAVILLRRRGGVDEAEGAATFDFLLAVGPTLVGVACGLLLLRLYPLAIRAMAWLGARLTGLVFFVGFRRVLQQPLSGRLPVVVVLICVATATYTAVLRTTIDLGQERSSWQAVGADFAVKGASSDASVPAAVDVTSLGDIDRIAGGLTFVNARVEAGLSSAPTEALALDMPAYREVVAGTPGEIPLPSFLFDQPSPVSGTAESPIPVIVSREWPGIDLQPGDVFTLGLTTADPTMVVREVRDRFPDIDGGSSFVVFSLNQYEAFNQVETPRTVFYLRAAEEQQETLRQNLAEQATLGRLISRYGYLDELAEDPFISWASTLLAAMFFCAGLFAVVATVASLAIASARRRRDFGYLRTMGLESRQAVWLTIIEQVPVVSLGTLSGVVVGVGTIVLLAPVFEIGEFTGGLVPIDITVDWMVIAGLGIAVALALTAAIVIFVLVNKREQLSQILRIGDEP